MAPSTRYGTLPGTVVPPPWDPWRRISSAVLAVLAGLALVAAVIAGYAGSLVSNTDRYVATIGPVIQDQAVQDDLSGQISDQITSRMDISSSIQDAVAERSDTRAAQGLASVLGPRIAERTNTLVEQTVSKAVASQAFAAIWTDANRAAHQVLVRAVEDDPGGIASIAENGNVSISTTAMIAEAKSRLLAQGVGVASAIPDDAGRDYTVFSAPGLASAISALDALGRVAALLPWAAFLLAAGAVLLAPAGRRLRSGIIFSLSSAGAALPAVLAIRAMRHLRICQACAAALTVLVLFLPGIAAGIVLGVAAVMVAAIIVLEVMARTQQTPASPAAA